jgi:hypothetical protein
MIDVYKTVLQRAGWALPRPSLYTFIFFKIKEIKKQTQQHKTFSHYTHSQNNSTRSNTNTPLGKKNTTEH